MRYAQEFSPSAHRKEKSRLFCLLFSVWRRRRDTAPMGQVTRSVLRCRTRLVRRTNFCACAQKCSHPPRTATRKSTARVLFPFWRRRRDTARGGRLLAACSGGSSTASVSHKARKANNLRYAQVFSPSAHRKEKKQAFCLLFFFGGGGGIRTPVGLHPNGFQVSLCVCCLPFVIAV